jgi:hypothetical protein
MPLLLRRMIWELMDPQRAIPLVHRTRILFFVWPLLLGVAYEFSKFLAAWKLLCRCCRASVHYWTVWETIVLVNKVLHHHLSQNKLTSVWILVGSWLCAAGFASYLCLLTTGCYPRRYVSMIHSCSCTSRQLYGINHISCVKMTLLDRPVLWIMLSGLRWFIMKLTGSCCFASGAVKGLTWLCWCLWLFILIDDAYSYSSLLMKLMVIYPYCWWLMVFILLDDWWNFMVVQEWLDLWDYWMTCW